MDRTSKIRLNGDLGGTPFVRVIAADGEALGVMALADALRAALRAGLDLVEVNPRSDPPVCRILDFGKFKNAEMAKARNARRPTEPEDE